MTKSSLRETSVELEGDEIEWFGASRSPVFYRRPSLRLDRLLESVYIHVD